MKKVLIKPLVLIAVFISALVAFSIITNQENNDLTTTMSGATLPTMCFYNDGTAINELHGYVNEMDITGMRDSITPVGTDRILPMQIETYGMEVDSVSYEIRSMNGERLVADAVIEDFNRNGEAISADLQIQNILTPEEEYAMIFTITSGENSIYYYTRIMQTTECYADESLAFALEFHDYTFSENASDFIPTYMDAATGDATTLNYVDLSCTLRQITWAEFEGTPVTDVVASFKEINDSYNVILLHYVMSRTSEAGETEYYNIEEYFRLRQTSTRMYVLNYERTMEEIFRGENTFITGGDSIQLGIRSQDVEYDTNEDGTTVAFVQQGELWSYDVNNTAITQVFSFRGLEQIDDRENYDQHDIKIVRVDEAGSIDFIVYGYMNRGEHEGEVGIGVYHYDGLAHTIEEEAFIPSTSSYEVLKAEMGQLMYENDRGQLYIMMEGTVYCIDLETLEVESVITGLKDGCYTASVSNQYFAWVETSEQYSSQVIHLMDLKDGTSEEIPAGEGEYVRPLGFIDEDFIYGTANAADVLVDAAGNTTFPMKNLKIMDTSEDSREILKEYTPASGYIGGISVSGYTIGVQLIQNTGGQYTASGNDSIMNREADTESVATITTTSTEIKQRQVQIELKSTMEDAKNKLITPRLVMQEASTRVELNLDESEERYYVYVKGEVTLATDSISDAILRANEDLGIVIGREQQYVWKRARKSAQSAFSNIGATEDDRMANSIVQCISAMLVRKGESVSVNNLIEQGYTPKEVLENTLKDSVVLDLTGCTVDEILFYVSQQNPVFAMTGTNSAVLVTGYNSERIYYYDPDSDDTGSMTMEEADARFAAAGNIFFTYLD